MYADAEGGTGKAIVPRRRRRRRLKEIRPAVHIENRGLMITRDAHGEGLATRIGKTSARGLV
jgi:hypothetical protein